jgi:glycine/D-amino acid oxidase-like deaminating enzyme
MRRIIVVGGGIVGVAAAAELAERGFSVMVIEQGPRDQLIGSTGHAPGYIGTFNESPVLTALAQANVACYSKLSQAGLKGFDQVESLEIARTDTTMNDLVRRAAKAREAGLEAQLISAANAATLAPDLIDVQNCVGAVLYAKDGTARASVITSALRERATHAGACFVYDARVTDIETRGGRVNAVYTEAGRVPADDVIIACGIWVQLSPPWLDTQCRSHLSPTPCLRSRPLGTLPYCTLRTLARRSCLCTRAWQSIGLGHVQSRPNCSSCGGAWQVSRTAMAW